MTEMKLYKEKTFDEIKHIDSDGNEYWEARELMPLLEYSKWENFHHIKSAIVACEMSNNNINDCFPEARKSIISGKGRESYIIDNQLKDTLVT